MIWRSVLLPMLMLGLALTPAPITSAQTSDTKPVARIDGSWVFQAWTGDGCSFSGNATIGRSSASETGYTCELTAYQTCPEREWIVRQTCTATRQGNRVAIKSTISEFLSEPSASYLPDDFLLTVESSRRMFGALHSYGVYKAEWTRDEGNVS